MASQPSSTWQDPFLFDEQLTEEERLIRDTARQFADDKLMPRIAGDFPPTRRAAWTILMGHYHRSLVLSLNALDDRGDALADADAHADQGITPAGPLELAQRGQG